MEENWSFESIREGQAASSPVVYDISSEVYGGFLNTFSDYSPIHIDDHFAQKFGFRSRVMHGSILNGFISHYIGMVFPAQRGFLLSNDIRYANPCYEGDKIQIEATISQVSPVQNVVVLTMILTNISQNYVAARAKVQVRILRIL